MENLRIFSQCNEYEYPVITRRRGINGVPAIACAVVATYAIAGVHFFYHVCLRVPRHYWWEFWLQSSGEYFAAAMIAVVMALLTDLWVVHSSAKQPLWRSLLYAWVSCVFVVWSLALTYVLLSPTSGFWPGWSDYAGYAAFATAFLVLYSLLRLFLQWCFHWPWRAAE